LAAKDWFDSGLVEIDLWYGWDDFLPDDEKEQVMRFIDWGEIMSNLNPELLMSSVMCEEDICLNCGHNVRNCAILDPHCIAFASPP